MTEPMATRREVDILRARVDQIDQLGTRGTVAAVTTLAAQMAEVIRDVGEVRGQMTAHDQRHDREQRDRAAGRRWLVGTIVAMLAVLVAVLATVVPLAIHRT